MRFYSYYGGGAICLGALDGETVAPLSTVGFKGHMLELIELGLEGASALARSALSRPDHMKHRIQDLKPAPIVSRAKRTIFCAGKNYADHAIEYTNSGYDKPDAPEIPTEPHTFFKLGECLIGPEEPVDAQPNATSELDYEAELAALLCSGGRGLDRKAAEACIFGYFIVNDLTARDWQKGQDQWVVGKSFDGYLPVGSILVTPDEIKTPSDLSFECHVNGELRQKGDPSQLIFDVADIVSYISTGVTMMSGDIITTGSPLGPGIGFNPPRFLKAGDIVKITSALMGELATPIR